MDCGEDEGDDDIVIVSKLNLNVPPMQYSKSYYDTNMKSFETDCRKITSNSPQLSRCSNSVLSNENLVTTITKNPLKTSQSDTSQDKAVITKEELKMNRRMSLANRGNKQRFVHHITTSFAKHASNNGLVAQFDVDGLKMYNNLALNGSKSETACQEIHAGGFSCIEEHKFQHTHSFLRRAQSFNLNLNLSHSGGFDSDASASNDSTRFANLNSRLSNQQNIHHQLTASQSCTNIYAGNAYKSQSFQATRYMITEFILEDTNGQSSI